MRSSSSMNVSLPKRAICLFACCLLLPTIIFCQDHVIAPASSAAAPAVPVVPQIFALPGGVAFQVKADEMTDQRGCRVETPLFGAYAVFDGRGAEIKTAESIGVEYNEKAILRIADREPFELYVPQRPNTILIPPSHTADFVGALYARERIRLRFTQWPGAQEKNLELEVGDFAAGYDLGVELCGWPKPSIARVPLSHDPEITRGTEGKIFARFGGVEGWVVYIEPRQNWCAVRGPFGKSIATYMDGKVQSDKDLGVVRYFTSHGKFVASTEHRPGIPAPTVAIMNAAARVGEDGMIEVGHHLYSFFGLREALQFAAKTCNQPALLP